MSATPSPLKSPLVIDAVHAAPGHCTSVTVGSLSVPVDGSSLTTLLTASPVIVACALTRPTEALNGTSIPASKMTVALRAAGSVKAGVCSVSVGNSFVGPVAIGARRTPRASVPVMTSSLPSLASTSGRPSTWPISWTSTVTRSILSTASGPIVLPNSSSSFGVGSTNQPQPAAVRSNAIEAPRASPSIAPGRSVSSIAIDSSLRRSCALSPDARQRARAASSAGATSPDFSGIVMTAAGASPSAASNRDEITVVVGLNGSPGVVTVAESVRMPS